MATLINVHTIQLSERLFLRRDGANMPWYLAHTERGMFSLPSTHAQRIIDIIAEELAKP